MECTRSSRLKLEFVGFEGLKLDCTRLRGLELGKLKRLELGGLKGLEVDGLNGLELGGLKRLELGGLNRLDLGGLKGLKGFWYDAILLMSWTVLKEGMELKADDWRRNKGELQLKDLREWNSCDNLK